MNGETGDQRPDDQANDDTQQWFSEIEDQQERLRRRSGRILGRPAGNGGRALSAAGLRLRGVRPSPWSFARIGCAVSSNQHRGDGRTER